MTEQEMIDRGTTAKDLLDNVVFQAVANSLMDTYLASIVNTSPSEEKVREAAYYQIKGLQDIYAVLNQWHGIKEQILESRKEAETYSEEE